MGRFEKDIRGMKMGLNKIVMLLEAEEKRLQLRANLLKEIRNTLGDCPNNSNISQAVDILRDMLDNDEMEDEAPF